MEMMIELGFRERGGVKKAKRGRANTEVRRK